MLASRGSSTARPCARSWWCRAAWSASCWAERTGSGSSRFEGMLVSSPDSTGLHGGSAVTLAVRRSRVVLAVLVVAALAAAWLVVGAAKSSQALNGKVLILSTTFASQSDFNEAVAAQSLGLPADVVAPEQWAAMTTEQFAQYDAIILGDNACGEDPDTGDDGYDSSIVLAAALANLPTWVPAVTGNVFVSTSDA